MSTLELPKLVKIPSTTASKYSTQDGRYTVTKRGSGTYASWGVDDTTGEYKYVGQNRQKVYGTKKAATEALAKHLEDPSVSMTQAQADDLAAHQAEVDALPFADRTTGLLFYPCGVPASSSIYEGGRISMCACGQLHSAPDVVEVTVKIGSLYDIAEAALAHTDDETTGLGLAKRRWSDGTAANIHDEGQAREIIAAGRKPHTKDN